MLISYLASLCYNLLTLEIHALNNNNYNYNKKAFEQQSFSATNTLSSKYC